jgi:hypothetical protein
MYADVERVRFDATQHFLRVVQQQGRVMMAAETNEQVAILLRLVETLAADVLGPGGTPAIRDDTGAARPGPGFAITVDGQDLAIAPGHYWVGGRLCELEVGASWKRQPDFRPEPDAFPAAGTHVVYLDVWERHVGAAEDPRLVEVALGGPDSCSRTRLVWQVKIIGEVANATPNSVRNKWTKIEEKLGRLSDGGRLAADVDRTVHDPAPCLAAPGAGYTGGENQLIRVEIHRGGPAAQATFKWAYDNASVAHRVVRVDGTSVRLSQPPRDLRKGLERGTRVELLSDEQVRAGGVAGLLTTVHDVDVGTDEFELVLDHPSPFAFDEDDVDAQGRPRWAVLRRWDHTGKDLVEGARPLKETEALALAAGVRIRFAPPTAPAAPWTYRTGDYWTIPVRVATGDVVWPTAGGVPVPMPPAGVDHRYAPLALIKGGVVEDARSFFAPLAIPLP